MKSILIDDFHYDILERMLVVWNEETGGKFTMADMIHVYVTVIGLLNRDHLDVFEEVMGTALEYVTKTKGGQ